MTMDGSSRDDVPVGLRTLAVRDDVQRVSLPVHVLYPTDAPAQARRIGPYELRVADDAPILGSGLPVVVISHGNNGSPWTHRGTALHLARAGFLVVMPEHIGNSRSDGSLAGTAAILEHRPRHVVLAVNALLADRVLGGAASRDGIAVVGHSIGAYTALAVAGGEPATTRFDTPAGPSRPVRVVRGPQVRALVLLAPATPWLMQPGALANVSAPVLLYAGERDTITPPDMHAAIVRRGVQDGGRVEYVVVPGAGHFSFQTPVPAAMVSASFPPSHDPPGFARDAFHPVLNRAIETFLRAHATGSA